MVDSDSSPLARECPPEYRELSSMHTRCLEKSKYVTKEGLSSADKREIVQLHNNWRSKIIKPAKGMMRVVNLNLNLLFTVKIILKWFNFLSIGMGSAYYMIHAFIESRFLLRSVKPSGEVINASE